MNKVFLSEVRAKRKLKKLTQEKVAEYLGMSRRAYISFENGNSNFRYENKLQKLCELLEIDFDKETIYAEDKEEILYVPGNSMTTMTITIKFSFSPS